MIRAIRRELATILDIRPQERIRVLLLSLYFFLVITSYYVIKPVRNSLFIQRVGADNLPYVYILTALFVGLLITVYSHWADRITRRALVQGTFAFLASNLLIFWWVLNRGGLLSSGAFYIWGRIYPLLLVSQFWLVANDYFTTPQAKRVFGVIGGGGIIGGVVGSSVSGGFATLLGSERLLLVSAGLLGVCALLLLVIDRSLTPVQSVARVIRDAERSRGSWRLLRESPHLRAIAYVLGLTIITSTIVDWQLSKAVELFVPGEDAKTAFFGQFFVALNVMSVIIQFLLTSWVLRVLGVGVGLLFLPIGLMTGSIGILVHPSLWTAAFAKGTEGALRYSLDQSTRELLFIPLPPQLKFRGKPLIDLVVYRGGTGIAGIILLVGTGVFSLGLRGMAVVSGAVIVIWLVATAVMRREFKASVRRLIRTRDVDARELLLQYLDPGTRADLVQALESANETEVIYALSLLDGIDDREIILRADRLLNHPSERVRAGVLKVLSEAHAADLREAGTYLNLAEQMVMDRSMVVRTEAIRFVCRFGPASDIDTLRGFMEAAEPEMRAAALAVAATHGNLEERDTARTLLLAMARQRDGTRAIGERKAAAEAMGLTADPELHAALADLIHDSSAGIQFAAIRAASRSQDPSLVPDLLATLCCAHTRGAARAALVSYGTDVLEPILQHLRDSSVPLEVRLAIPSILYELRDQQAADALVRLLPRLRPVTLRRAALRALNRIRRNQPEVRFDPAVLERILKIEIRKSYQFAVDRVVLGPEGVLGALLEEHRARAFERVSRVLGLMYPQRDILTAYQGLRSESEALRAAGFELIDSTLSVTHRRMVVPLADPELPVLERAQRGARLIRRVVRQDRQAVLDRLASDEDAPWLAAVASAKGGRGRRGRADPVKPPFHLHLLPQIGLPFRALLNSQDEGLILQLVERAEFLRQVEVFSFVRAEDLAKIAAIAQERSFAAGETVFREGEEGSQMYLIVSGRMQASRGGEAAYVVGPGETAGTLTLIDARPRESTMVAINDVEVLAIGRDDFFDVMRSHFNVAEGMLIHLARMLRKQQERPEIELG